MESKEIMRMRNKNKMCSLTSGNILPMPRVGLYVDYPNLYATMRDKGSQTDLEKLLAVSQSLGNLIFAIGAVIGAVAFKFLAEIAICASIAFTVFIGLNYVSGAGVVIAGIAALIAFVVTYYRFNKVVIYVAAFAGALAIWIALYGMGLPDVSAQVFAAAAMIMGIVLQKYEASQDKIQRSRIRSDY